LSLFSPKIKEILAPFPELLSISASLKFWQNLPLLIRSSSKMPPSAFTEVILNNAFSFLSKKLSK